MNRYSRQTIANPELFAICARRTSNQELLEQIEWLPHWACDTIRLARQILFDRFVKDYKAPPEAIEPPAEENGKKPKHSPATLLSGF